MRDRAAFAYMTKVSGAALVAALVIVLGLAMPLHAQVCPPASIEYTPRTSSGAFLSAGDLEALRAQLPEIFGLDIGIDSRSTTPGLVFTNRYPCEVDLRDVTLVHDGMRMHLWFDVRLLPSHFLKIDGPPFQNADFVFDRSGLSADRLQSAPASSWKPISEMGSTPGTTPLARDCPSTLRLDDTGLLSIRVRRQSPSERRQCIAYLVSALSDTAKPELRKRAAKAIETIASLIDDAAFLDPLVRCVARYSDPAAADCNLALNELTRHSYGYQFFMRHTGAPTPYDPQRIVEDWRSYMSRPGASHAIFDAFLREQSLHAMQDVVRALRRAIVTALPGHPSLTAFDENAVHLFVQDGLPFETICDFRISEAQPHSAYIAPLEWPPGTPLQGVRVQLLRPGIPRPATADTSWDGSRVLAEAATYREEFRNLDLEIRFQITTTDATLRAAAVKEVRDALAGLRATDRAAR